MFFTFIAVPKVILVEDLWLGELIEAVVDANLLLLVVLIYSVLLIDSLALFDSGKMLDQVELEIAVEDEIQDKVALSVLLVEAHVVFDSNLVQHVENGHLVGVWNWAVPVAIVVVTEMAVLSIAGIIFDFKLIWHISLVEVLHGEHIFPVCFGESWEERLELLLYVTIFEKLF